MQRIRHARLLYEGAREVRTWLAAKNNDTLSEINRQEIREEQLTNANQKLEEAKKISSDMVKVFQKMEGQYRYPVELLAREKPESLTAYPFG